jgi:aminomethyltransferase
VVNETLRPGRDASPGNQRDNHVTEKEAPLNSGKRHLRTTAFHPRTSELCQSHAWRRWGGYLSASCYELTHDREYSAIRTSAALLDISPLRKYRVEGPDALCLLDRMVTRDLSRCRVGQMVYTGWCDSRGKLLDDGTVARLGEQDFRLTSAEPSLRWLGHCADGLQVGITDETHSIPALALQGPRSRDVLKGVVTGADMDDLRFFRLAQDARIQGARVTVSRTGYTGDLGYEIWVEDGDPLAVWDALIEEGTRHGLVPSGIWALDVARIEAGFIMAGVDYVPAHHALAPSQTSSPFEVGLDWCVHLDAGPFVGREALVEEKARGPGWGMVGVELDWDSLDEAYMTYGLRPSLPIQAWRSSHPLFRGRRQVGYATSGCWSPTLKKYLLLGQVEAPFSDPGTEVEFELSVEHRPHRILARVSERPFFDPPRKRE